MILQETIKIGKRDFIRSYSDSGKMIRKIGTESIYAEAIDVIPCAYTYEETEIEIDGEGVDSDG